MALVLGLPTDIVTISAALQSDPGTLDYAWLLALHVIGSPAKAALANRPLDAQEADTFAEQIVAAPDTQLFFRAMSHLAERAHELGIEVFEKASLHDLEIATLWPGVIIFTHWRGATIAPPDILDRSGKGDLRLAVSSLADRLHREAPPAGQEAARRWLNDLIAGPEPLYSQSAADEAISETMGSAPIYDDAFHASLNREWIDTALGPTVLAPGNRLELSDGMHAAASVADHLGERKDGLTAFLACHSIVLQQVMRARSPDIRMIGAAGGLLPVPLATILADALAAPKGETHALYDRLVTRLDVYARAAAAQIRKARHG